MEDHTLCHCKLPSEALLMSPHVAFIQQTSHTDNKFCHRLGQIQLDSMRAKNWLNSLLGVLIWGQQDRLAITTEVLVCIISTYPYLLAIVKRTSTAALSTTT